MFKILNKAKYNLLQAAIIRLTSSISLRSQNNYQNAVGRPTDFSSQNQNCCLSFVYVKSYFACLPVRSLDNFFNMIEIY